MAGRVGKVAQLEQAARATGDEGLRAEVQRQLEHQQTLAQEAHRREVAEFMKREGLKSVEDCRSYCRRMMRGSIGVHSFEAWARVMRQDTVDRMVLMDTPDDQRVLARLRRECVIDEQNRLIPLEERDALRAQRDEERRAAALDEVLDIGGQG